MTLSSGGPTSAGWFLWEDRLPEQTEDQKMQVFLGSSYRIPLQTAKELSTLYHRGTVLVKWHKLAVANLVNFDNFPFVLHFNISSLAGVKKLSQFQLLKYVLPTG